MKTMLAAITAALLLIAAQATAQERPVHLAGLTENEFSGCGYIQLATGSMDSVDPEECGDIKRKLNGNWALCYASVLKASMRRTNEAPSRDVKGLGMFGCSMLVNDTPEGTARDAARKAIK